MKHPKSITHILLFITIQILQSCQAQTCFTSNITVIDKYNGFTCVLFENEKQLELVNTHDYLLRYATRLDTGDQSIGFGSITNLNFEIDVSNEGPDNTDIFFGYNINVSNFTFSSSTAFYAKITGYHTFKISADDAALVSLLPSYDFFCCKYTTDPGDDPLAWFLGLYENYTTIIEYTGSPDDTSKVTLYLTAGEPVLMYMAYVNRAGSARFNITVTDPDNVSFTDLSDYVYGTDLDLICNDEVDILELASVLSSTTYSTDVVTTTMNVIGYPAYATTYYVKVPMSTIESSSVITESSTGVYSSSIESSESSNNVVSSVTESSDASTSVVESSTFSYKVSSTPVSSSMASSDVSSAVISSSIFSSGESSIPVSSSITSSEELSSTIRSSSTDSDITSGAASSSSDTSRYLSSLPDSSMHSSDMPYSSTKSVVAHSSVTSGSISDSLSTSKMTSGTSEDSSQSSILSIESSTSVAYTYTNSSSTGSITTSSSSNIEESSGIAHTSTAEATKKTSTTVTIPCTSEECQVTSKPSTDYISDTFVITSTVTTICPVSESGSMNFVTSTYVTKITTVVQSTYCPGGCTAAEPEYVHSANTGTSLVQETSTPQGTSNSQDTSSSYIVQLNENGVTKSSFGILTLLVSIMSLFTFI